MKDQNYISYYGDRPDTSAWSPPADPKLYDDVMKFSNCTNVDVRGRVIPGGKENAIDCVRGENYRFERCQIGAGGEASVVFKGSIRGWTLDRCVFAPNKIHVELGQFSDYWKPGAPKTNYGAILDCHTTDGSPIVVICWDAVPPAVIDSHVKIIVQPWFVVKPYFIGRWLWLKLKKK
jgi:hypothetical protein